MDSVELKKKADYLRPVSYTHLLDNRTKGAVVDEYFQTNVDGIFAAGNVLHVHDLVDFVSMEAEKLADSVTEYIEKGKRCV